MGLGFGALVISPAGSRMMERRDVTTTASAATAAAGLVIL